MGTGGDLAAVADAGPLIHLREAGALAFLGVFSGIHIPKAVWQEVVGAGRVSGNELESVVPIQQHELEPAHVHRAVQDNKLVELHQGEIECLCLCQQLGIPLMLTDDLAAREAAWRLGIRPVGSLGIVVRACHARRLSVREAEQFLERLYASSSLFVTRAIVDSAIQELARAAGMPPQ